MKIGDLVKWHPIDSYARYGLVMYYDCETWLCTVLFYNGSYEIEEMYLEVLREDR